MASQSSMAHSMRDMARSVEQNRWLEIDEHDDQLAHLWMELMKRVSSSYRRETAQSLQAWICQRRSVGANAFYYESATYALALRFDYVPMWRRYQALSGGFVGDILPAGALNLLIDQMVTFLRAAPDRLPHQVVQKDALIAICPKRIDEPKMLELFDELTRNPRLRTTLEKETADDRRFRLELLDLGDT